MRSNIFNRQILKEMEDKEMLVVASTENSKKNRIYHRYGCIYANRIKPNHRMEMEATPIVRHRYRKCKYCGGLYGDVRVHMSRLEDLSTRKNVNFIYNRDTDTFYIQTEIGFWKIYSEDKTDKYILYHRNAYESGMDLETAMWGEFHRQADVKITSSMDKIVDYVIKHDAAKIIIQDDYRKLPKRTKKQKKYFRSAERKAKRKEMQRLDYLFAAIAQA